MWSNVTVLSSREEEGGRSWGVIPQSEWWKLREARLYSQQERMKSEGENVTVHSETSHAVMESPFGVTPCVLYCLRAYLGSDTHVGVSAGVSSHCQRGGSAVSGPGLTRGHAETPPSLGLSLLPPVAAKNNQYPMLWCSKIVDFSPMFPLCFSKMKDAASDPGSQRLFGVKM